MNYTHSITQTNTSTNMKSLYILRGLPGAGKTTLAQNIICNKGRMVAADDFMGKTFDATRLKECHRKCKETVDEWMELGVNPICVHNTFTQEWEMEDYHKLAEYHGYTVFHMIVENRHGNASVHNVPASTLKKMMDRFEVKLVPDSALETPEKRGGIYGTLPVDDMTLREVVESMKSVQQRPDYHPEGDVYTHTAIVMGRLGYNNPYDPVLWAALFHDLGKYDTTKIHPKTGHLISYGHENVSADYVRKFHYAIPARVDFAAVEWLVRNHMRIHMMDKMRESKQQELKSHPYYSSLERLGRCDDMLEFYRRLVDIPGYLTHFESWMDDWIR